MTTSTPLNPFALALVGAPILLGIYLRIRFRNKEVLKANAIITSLVMLTVAIGYSLNRFQNPEPFFVTLAPTIFLLGAVGLPLVALVKIADQGWGCRTYIGSCLWGLILLAVTFFAISNNGTPFLAPVAVITVFCLAGLANVYLGPVAAGFSIAMTLNSYFTTGTLDYVYVWNDIFEFLNISSFPLKVMVLTASALCGSAELLAALREHSLGSNA